MYHSTTLQENENENELSSTVLFSRFSEVDYELQDSEISLSNIKPVFDNPVISQPESITIIRNTSNSPIYIPDLNLYFNSIIENDDLKFVLSNIHSYDDSIYLEQPHVVLNNSNLTINPDYRGTRYNVNVFAINQSRAYTYIEDNRTRYLSQPFTFDVIELQKPPILLPLGDNFQFTFPPFDVSPYIVNNFNTYFEHQFSFNTEFKTISLQFELVNNTLPFVSLTNNFTNLQITPDFRDSNYHVVIQATDNVYHTQNAITFSITELPPINTPQDIVTFTETPSGYNEFIIDITTLFVSNRFINNDIQFQFDCNVLQQDNIRNHLIDNDTYPFFSTDPDNSNIIYVNTDFRNQTNRITVSATDLQYPTLPAIVHIDIVELSPPKPYIIGPKVITVENEITSVSIDSLFSAGTQSQEIEFVLLTNTFDIFTLSDDRKNINIEHVLRLESDTKILHVGAIDTLYNVQNDTFDYVIIEVPESPSVNILQEAIIPNILLAPNSTHTVTLNDYFSVTDNDTILYKFVVEGLPSDDLLLNRQTNQPIAEITEDNDNNNTIISITSDYRNTTYNVIVYAWNSSYPQFENNYPLIITITEDSAIPPALIRTTPNDFITTNTQQTIDLTQYFVSSMNSPSLTFEITSDTPIQSLYELDNQNGTLTLTPDLRDISYTLNIRAIDASYLSVSSPLQFTVREEHPAIWRRHERPGRLWRRARHDGGQR